MRSCMWIVIATVAVVTLVAIGIRRKREREEADRMAVWG
jgi:hypothetical protein